MPETTIEMSDAAFGAQLSELIKYGRKVPAIVLVRKQLNTSLRGTMDYIYNHFPEEKWAAPEVKAVKLTALKAFIEQARKDKWEDGRILDEPDASFLGGKGNKTYDMTLPSKPPFMYIESHDTVKDPGGDVIGIIAFGAYNAMGLIGPEMGGVAIVVETRKAVMASKTLPYDREARKALHDRIVKFLNSITNLPDEEFKKELIGWLQANSFALRW